MAHLRTLATLLGLTALLAADLAAQRRPPVPRAGDPPPEDDRMFDAVIGIFGDKVILESDIRVDLEQRIRSAERQGVAMTEDDRAFIRTHIIMTKLREVALAQSTLIGIGGNERDEIDKWIERQLELDRQEQIDRAGSINQLSSDLGVLGKTLDSIDEARRTELLAQMATYQALRRRFKDQIALSVTPREIKRYYDEHPEQFTQEASADLEIVVLRSDVADATAVAAQAVASWQQSGAPASEVAAAIGGIALDVRERVRDVPDDPNPPEIKAFAARAAEGEVSQPLAVGSAIWLVRVKARREGFHDSFDDPKIQNLILAELVSQRRESEMERLIKENQNKFEPIPRAGWRR